MTLREIVYRISGQDVYMCMQCGTCSASCTGRDYMSTSPRMIMRLLQMNRQVILKESSFWLCTTCLKCTVNCPRGIDVAGVLEALRITILRKMESFLEPEQMRNKGVLGLPQVALVAAMRKMSA